MRSGSAREDRRIYFIKPINMDGPIKIGCSNLPERRLRSLAVWSPFPLEIIGSIPGSFSEERFLQRCFSDLHTHNEWFRVTLELQTAIQTVLRHGSVDVIRATHIPKEDIRPVASRAWPDDRRLRVSYGSRIRHATSRLRKRNEDGPWREPDDIAAIMAKWSDGNTPSQAELSRLGEFLAAPEKYAVVPWFARRAA